MTRYLAFIQRDSCSYPLCRKGCCGWGETESLFEKCYTENRAEIVSFLAESYAHAALYETPPGDPQYAERKHSLYINGFPDDVEADEYSENYSEQVALLAEMAALKAEAQGAAQILLAEAKAKEAEDERIAKEKKIVAQREADLRRLADLDRQKAELQAKLGEVA